MLRIPAAATAAIAVVLVAWWMASHLAADRRLAALAPLAEARGNYRITLDFPPERFHQLRLQEAGRLVEVRGNTVHMMDVAPDELRRIAGQHWVAAIAQWDGR